MTGRSALVTGGAGYIGSHAVLALLEAGWRVAVLDDLSTGRREAVPAGVAFHRADIADGPAVARALAAHDVDAVLHFAGSISASASVGDPLRYFDNNTGRTRALLRTVVDAGVERFVFSSSAAVYGAPARSPVAETAATAPINPYGWSKLMSEQMLAACARAHGLRSASLRYFNVVGADPLGRAGPRSAAGAALVDVALDCAQGRRPAVPVHGTDYPTRDGTGVRDYIHVCDVASAHVHALEALERDAEPLVLNCGYGRGASVREVLAAARLATGRPLPEARLPRRPGDPAEVVADNRRILAQTAWRPRHGELVPMIADAWRWRRALQTADAG